MNTKSSRGYQRNKTRKVEVWSAVPPRQRVDSQKRHGHDCHKDAGFEVLEQPPYPPDLTPSDFFLFPKLKDEEVEAAVGGWLAGQIEEFFTKGIEALHHRA